MRQRSLTFGTLREDLQGEQRRNGLELIGLRSLLEQGRCHGALQQRLQTRRLELEERQRELERIRSLLRDTNQ